MRKKSSSEVEQDNSVCVAGSNPASSFSFTFLGGIIMKKQNSRGDD